MRHRSHISAILCAALGCGGGAGDGLSDGPSGSDAGAVGDASPPDAGPITEILGTLHGACPGITPFIAATESSLADDQLVFVTGESYDRSALSPGGQRVYDTPNAGGSSTESEVMSFEVLHFCDGAELVKTEIEILYAEPDDAGSNAITDLLVAFAGQKVGVSVTRAYRPTPEGMTDAEALELLERKLTDINRSSERVLEEDRWVKQILHVFVATEAAATQVVRLVPMIDAGVRADTIILVTRTEGGGFIYCDPDPPLGTECPFL